MRRRFFVMNGSVLTYTSITNQKLAINPSAFNIPVKSHTYDEIGLIKFNGVLSEIASTIFRDSYSLSTCVLPTKITKIGDNAFIHCYNLTSVTIPGSVTTIGDYAFFDCDILTSVYCKATTPPTLGGTYVFFNDATNRKIYVPYQSLDAYKTAQYWSKHADDIVGYDFENNALIITFKVNGVEYQALEGMTWEEFVNSEYNVDGFFCESNNVRVANGMPLSSQTPSDVIDNGSMYSANYTGGDAA